ncbi:MAG: hypothetical protein OXB84_07885 [Halobacteriovoraceae bacterium]|nr:hypothetical protein [Halobacteriovoraceae bacterium]
MFTTKKFIHLSLAMFLCGLLASASHAAGKRERGESSVDQAYAAAAEELEIEESNLKELLIEEMIGNIIVDYDKNGILVTLDTVNSKDYNVGDIHLFISEAKVDGKVVAHGLTGKETAENNNLHIYREVQVGTANYNIIDEDGLYIMVRMIERAVENTGFWIDYNWINPESGEVALRKSYFVLHDGYLFVAGYYPEDKTDEL